MFHEFHLTLALGGNPSLSVHFAVFIVYFFVLFLSQREIYLPSFRNFSFFYSPYNNKMLCVRPAIGESNGLAVLADATFLHSSKPKEVTGDPQKDYPVKKFVLQNCMLEC